MSGLILSSSDEFMTTYLAQTLYPGVEFEGNIARVGEIVVMIAPEGQSVVGFAADRVIILDDGHFRDLKAWSSHLCLRLVRYGRLFVIEHKADK